MSTRKKILVVAFTVAACVLAAVARYFFPQVPTVVLGIVIGVCVVAAVRLLLGKQK